MSNAITSFMRGQFQMAQNWFDGTLAGVDNAVAAWQPNGRPNPIGAQLAHVFATEDFFLASIAGRAPLMAGAYAGKSGFSEPPQAAEGTDWSAWAHRVQIDMPAIQAYIAAVHQQTDDLLAGMTDADLQRPFDLSMVNVPDGTVGMALNLLLLNKYCHAGEISALKGMQGMVGYPG
jgi:hypothetical protein